MPDSPRQLFENSGGMKLLHAAILSKEGYLGTRSGSDGEFYRGIASEFYFLVVLVNVCPKRTELFPVLKSGDDSLYPGKARPFNFGVVGILCAGDNPKIGAPVVERVSVDMVNDLSVSVSEAQQEAMQEDKSLPAVLNNEASSVVRLGFLAEFSQPSECGYNLKIFGADQGSIFASHRNEIIFRSRHCHSFSKVYYRRHD